MRVTRIQAATRYRKTQQKKVFKKKYVTVLMRKGPPEEGKGERIDIYI